MDSREQDGQGEDRRGGGRICHVVQKLFVE